jgi:GTPase Era involved in 16S rRNA processing
MPFLKNGFELVDTPGVGSATLANTETTYSYLPVCDAVIFVISGEAPMTESEVNFIADIHDYTKRIFFVVNKIDLLTSQELNETLNYVEKKIREVTGIISPVIFPLSAQEGLQSRLTNNQTTYKQSGLQKFEEELASFLSNEKMLDFIGILCKKKHSL